MIPRNLFGFRLFVIVVGVNLIGDGVIMAGSYLDMHEPSNFEQRFNPELVGVTYPAPKWLLNIGLALVVIGVVLSVVGWQTSRRRREREHLRALAHPRLIFASFVMTGIASLVIAAFAGERNPFVWVVFFLAALCLLCMPWAIRREKSGV